MRIEFFELIFGMIYISAGVAGLIPGALMPPPADAPALQVSLLYGHVLGIFPVNAVATALHMTLGVWGILAWRGEVRSTLYARSLAIVCAALAVIGLVPGMSTLFGLMPLYGNDVWLHGATAVVGAYFGWSSSVSLERRTRSGPDRREVTQPIPQDRRTGHPDRRLPGQVMEEKP